MLTPTERTIPVGPYYGMSSWHVGFIDLGVDDFNAPRLTGLAAFRDAKRRCLQSVRELAGPGWPIRVHRIKLTREEPRGGRKPIITMTVTTVTDHLPVKVRP